MRHILMSLLALLLASTPAAASAAMFTVLSGDFEDLRGDGSKGLMGSLSFDGSSSLGLDLTGVSTPTVISTPSDLAVSLSDNMVSVEGGQIVALDLGINSGETAGITGTCRLEGGGSSMTCGFTLIGSSYWRINELTAVASASPIPEPSSVIVFGLGALVVGRSLRRQRSR